MTTPTFYTCWANYFATGEGNTLMFALGNTEAIARNTFKNAFGEYFAQGAHCVEGLPVVAKIPMERYVPAYILEMFDKGDIPVLQYYQQHHYNLS